MTSRTPEYGEQPAERHDPVDPAYDTTHDRSADAPAVRNEPMPQHLDEHRDVHVEDDEVVTETKVKSSVAGSTWAALIIGALLLILLLIFILQNQQSVELNLFAWSFAFPAGIGYLFSAITGALIMALVGGVRMLELRRQVRRQRRR
ncbi:LapA family protein [Corynebacterium suedekumii]